MVNAGCQTKRTLELGIVVQCDIVRKNEEEFLRAALKHAEQHISTNEKYQVGMVSNIDELKRQVLAERKVSEGRLDELLQLKKERLNVAKKVLGQNS